MAKLVNCKTCGKQVSTTAPTCPHCGENAPGVHIRCPKCGSMNIASGQKGYGLGKAAAGGILLGPVGLLGGMIGRKKIELVCQDCGKGWDPSEKPKKTVTIAPKTFKIVLLVYVAVVALVVLYVIWAL